MVSVIQEAVSKFNSKTRLPPPRGLQGWRKRLLVPVELGEDAQPPVVVVLTEVEAQLPMEDVNIRRVGWPAGAAPEGSIRTADLADAIAGALHQRQGSRKNEMMGYRMDGSQHGGNAPMCTQVVYQQAWLSLCKRGIAAERAGRLKLPADDAHPPELALGGPDDVSLTEATTLPASVLAGRQPGNTGAGVATHVGAFRHRCFHQFHMS